MEIRRLNPDSDRDLIRSVVLSDAAWEAFRDDTMPDREDWEIPAHFAVFGVYAPQFCGCILLDPISATVASGHIALMPWGYGKGHAALEAFLAWLWVNTGCLMFYAEIQATNRLACHLAESVGMKMWGVQKAGHPKDGNWIDLHLYGCHKTEV